MSNPGQTENANRFAVARRIKVVRADSLGWDQKLAKRFKFASAGGGGMFLPAQSMESSPPQDVKRSALVPRAF